MHAIVSASPVQLRGTPNLGPHKARQRAPHREGSAVYKTTPPKKLYRTVKRNPLLLKSGLVYMPQVGPAHDPGRRVAPSMRYQSPVPNSQARGNGRKRSVCTVDCLVRFRNRYIDRFRLSQNRPPESLNKPGAYRL